MNTLAPELSALITILRSTGPVISTRRSSRSRGIGATVQLLVRISAVSGRKSGKDAGIDFRLFLDTRGETLAPGRLESAGQLGQKTHCLLGQDLPVGFGNGCANLDPVAEQRAVQAVCQIH